MIWIIIAIIVVLVIFVIASYNGLVKSRMQTKEAWSQIDVQLKRRNDLLPNLIETVKGYAKYEGSAAAPTAGLHFTKELLAEIKEMGVNLAFVTLHVGLGTFRPVNVDNIEDHVMHKEFYHIEKEAAYIINQTKANGGRVIAVGTTSIRTLESAAKEDGSISPIAEETGIFIYPGYKFKIVDSIITNFHLPKSTLIMLISAFAGREYVLSAYEEAVKEKYRFFSFGDAMLIK